MANADFLAMIKGTLKKVEDDNAAIARRNRSGYDDLSNQLLKAQAVLNDQKAEKARLMDGAMRIQTATELLQIATSLVSEDGYPHLLDNPCILTFVPSPRLVMAMMDYNGKLRKTISQTDFHNVFDMAGITYIGVDERMPTTETMNILNIARQLSPYGRVPVKRDGEPIVFPNYKEAVKFADEFLDTLMFDAKNDIKLLEKRVKQAKIQAGL